MMWPTFMKFPLVFCYVCLIVRQSPQHMRSCARPVLPNLKFTEGVPHIRRSVLRNEECVRIHSMGISVRSAKFRS
jgi:hypothetical protein